MCFSRSRPYFLLSVSVSFLSVLEVSTKIGSCGGKTTPSLHACLARSMATRAPPWPTSRKHKRKKKEKSWQHHPLRPLSPARGLHPFWTPSMTTTSQKLWSPPILGTNVQESRSRPARFGIQLLERTTPEYGSLWFRVTKTEAKMEPSLKMTSHFISSISVSSIGAYPLLRGDSQLHGKS